MSKDIKEEMHPFSIWKSNGLNADHYSLTVRKAMEEYASLRIDEATEKLKEEINRLKDGWVSASELPVKEKSLPAIVVTCINKRAFAYNTKYNLAGLKEVLKHHPDALVYCIQSLPEPPTTNE